MSAAAAITASPPGRGRTARLPAAAAATVALLAVGPATTVAAAEPPGRTTGAVTVGLRTVDVRGTAAKYREDVDLADGFRLFGFALRWTPAPGRRAFADLVDLDAAGLGGDPDSGFHLTVRRRGAYRLRLDRTRSATFYQDLIVPPERADPGLYTGGDLHTFDFDRVRDAARLDVDLAPRAKVHLGFERSARRGASATTVGLEGDLFRLERPIDDTLRAWRGGFEYRWDRVTLAVEEEVRETSDAGVSALPGPSAGDDPGDATSLALYLLRQPVETRARRHGVRLVAHPHPRFTARLAGSVSDLDLDFAAAQRRLGTGAGGRPIADEAAGGGAVSRGVDLVDLDLSYRIADRVTLIGGVSAKRLDQDGAASLPGFYYDGTYPAYPYSRGRWRIDTRGGKLGLRVDASPRLTVGGGVRGERREVAWSTSLRGDTTRVTTERSGLFADLGWRPVRGLRLTAAVETDAVDDPFSPAAPGRRTRVRLGARHRLAGGFSLAAHCLRDRSRNRDSGWEATTDQAGLQLAYERPGLTAALGWGGVSFDRSIAPTGDDAAPLPLRDRADAGFLDGRIAWTFAERWTVGGALRAYDNRGTFAVERTDASGFVEVALERGLSVRVALRTIDYDEAAADFDDYRAEVAELALGWRW